ncbi:hypothetical protein K450DRAFT_200283 [Umbelopsis ramanniana AG]|uniref:Alcohol dehydrogenase-like C-terminal domain-containing protein n=1 Tax=Umbelopsis ramanniana AG TaxID=1314678 RepID=A0AAD5E6T7_UMBRA|nr:uncharacterized protein K450DRAFT_200283 [Umbelopsis ramanniana AG]KAI8578451.1 hypothetical protein K450DRAFT_200283 [Umbelopsis ramanniana AG]
MYPAFSSYYHFRLLRKNYGADHVVNYKEHYDCEKDVLRLTNGKGVDFVIDNGGASSIAKLAASTKLGGQIVVVDFMASSMEMPDPLLGELVQLVRVKKLYTAKKINEQGEAALQYLKIRSNVGKAGIKVEYIIFNVLLINKMYHESLK